jgi:hypothetical protein
MQQAASTGIDPDQRPSFLIGRPTAPPNFTELTAAPTAPTSGGTEQSRRKKKVAAPEAPPRVWEESKKEKGAG